MSGSVLNKNSLMHSLQCVQAMTRMMEAYIADPAATNQDGEAFGQLLMDFDSVVDRLSTTHEAHPSSVAYKLTARARAYR